MMRGIIQRIASAVIAASMLFAVGCGSSSSGSDSSRKDTDGSLKRVKDAGKLVIGIDETFKPMGYTDENGEIVGFDIDVAKEVCKRIGIELEAKKVNWDAKEDELNAGSIDCVWNGLSISDERKQKMLMSAPYMSNQIVFMVNKDSGITAQSELAEKVVAVQDGSTAQETLVELSVYTSLEDVVVTDTYAEAISKLEQGEVDAVFIDSVVADYEITSAKKSMVTVNDTPFAEDYAIGFKLGSNDLCEKIQDVLKEMKKDGTLKEISEKWFGKDVTTVK